MKTVGLMLCLTFSLCVGSAEAKGPLKDVLGIAPGMTEDQAHHRLEAFGTRNEGEGEARERDEEGTRETWTLRHTRFTYVVMTFDESGRVDYVQGYLRKEGRRLRYADVGDLGKAKRIGYYIYSWDVPARGGQPALQIQARGSDPRFPGSYFITRRASGEHAGSDDERHDRDSREHELTRR